MSTTLLSVHHIALAGTPIIDPATDSLYVAAMSTPDGGTTTRQLIFRMNVYTGAIASGWPVDVAHCE